MHFGVLVITATTALVVGALLLIVTVSMPTVRQRHLTMSLGILSCLVTFFMGLNHPGFLVAAFVVLVLVAFPVSVVIGFMAN